MNRETYKRLAIQACFAAGAVQENEMAVDAIIAALDYLHGRKNTKGIGLDIAKYIVENAFALSDYDSGEAYAAALAAITAAEDFEWVNEVYAPQPYYSVGGEYSTPMEAALHFSELAWAKRQK